MRVPMLTALVTLTLTCPGQFCMAQAASPDAGPPQTLTGSGGSDRRGPDPAASRVLKDYPIAAPANTGQAARRDAVGRVGTLSPDEERRAARARARAVAAEKTAPASAAQKSPVHAEDHAADLRRPVPVETMAPARSASPVAKEAAVPARATAVPERSAVTASALVDRPPHPHVSERKRFAYTSVARHASWRTRARLADRLIAGDVARAPRVGDVVPPSVRLSPVPPYYGPDRGLYEGRAVALEPRPGFRTVFVAPRDLPYPPRAEWYAPPPPPPYGFPYPRYGF